MVTPNLGLLEIAENQALKYLTHNQALRVLDALLPRKVQGKTLAVAPDHFPGQVYIVADNARDEWAGKAGKLACSINDAWIFVAPQQGWRMFVCEEQRVYHFDGNKWQPPSLLQQWHDLGKLSGSVEIDVGLMGMQQGVLIDNIDLVLKPPANNGAASISLQLHQDEQGLRLVRWPDNLKFAEGKPPRLTLAPGAIDMMLISSCGNDDGFLLCELGLNFLPPMLKT